MRFLFCINRKEDAQMLNKVSPNPSQWWGGWAGVGVWGRHSNVTHWHGVSKISQILLQDKTHISKITTPLINFSLEFKDRQTTSHERNPTCRLNVKCIWVELKKLACNYCYDTCPQIKERKKEKHWLWDIKYRPESWQYPWGKSINYD